MKITFRLGLLAAAAGAGFWLWTVLFPSPERVVLKIVAGLADAATFGPDAGNLLRAGKASSVISRFAQDAEIIYDLPGAGTGAWSGRDEIREATAGGFARLPALKVQFFDAVARVGANKQTAVVTCTLRVSIGDGKDFGIQELRFQLKKIDGDWLISRVETVKTLS